MEIRPLRSDERRAWLLMRRRLWPEALLEDLARQQEEILADPERHMVLMAAERDGDPVGFVETTLRDWAEGGETRPVGHVEAWYVEPSHRRRGIGRKLVVAAEEWASSRGCAEMCSDAALENTISLSAHRALGYEEVGRAVLFRKRLAR